MKIIRGLLLIGSITFLLACALNMVNIFADKEIFPLYIVLPLLIVAAISSILGVVRYALQKEKK
ncbi:MAG: hypothetical protein IJY50_09595 [Clostridia bacterium]|nr:hypothetical protein [Clostridia bacterium]